MLTIKATPCLRITELLPGRVQRQNVLFITTSIRMMLLHQASIGSFQLRLRGTGCHLKHFVGIPGVIRAIGERRAQS